MEVADAVFTIPVRGQKIEVTHRVSVRDDTASASYNAKVGDKQLRADTLEALRDKLMNETKRAAVKVSVPFCLIVHPAYGRPTTTVLNGVITGIHAGSGKFLVRYEDGRTDQLDTYSRSLLKPLDKATAAELIGLRDENARLEKQIAALEAAHYLDAKTAVEAAINKASQTMPTPR